jgi:hypothetical protein
VPVEPRSHPARAARQVRPGYGPAARREEQGYKDAAGELAKFGTFVGGEQAIRGTERDAAGQCGGRERKETPTQCQGGDPDS